MTRHFAKRTGEQQGRKPNCKGFKTTHSILIELKLGKGRKEQDGKLVQAVAAEVTLGKRSVLNLLLGSGKLAIKEVGRFFCSFVFVFVLVVGGDYFKNKNSFLYMFILLVRAALSSRIFCDDGYILYLQCPIWQPLATRGYLNLNLLKLKSVSQLHKPHFKCAIATIIKT